MSNETSAAYACRRHLRCFCLLLCLASMLCVAAQTAPADFTASAIPDSIWHLMQGKTFHPNPHIQRDDLRLVRLLHWDYDNRTHHGELICNRKIADRIINIFRQLYLAHYPIERIELPDNYGADDETQMRANNTSCFCYRAVAGSKTLSKHAQGLAIDLNTLYNPYCKRRKDGTLVVQPATATPYVDRTCSFPYKISRDDLAYILFTKNGFEWGGDWRSLKDYQHFELKE